MTKSHRILVVGGGTAGWLTAGYLSRTLGADLPGGIEITLVESQDIGILGVGEGTFPTIRRTLSRIGIDEAEMVRRCGATFKQGAKFVNWRDGPGTMGPDNYLHAFQTADQHAGPELILYWLMGTAGDQPWDEVCSPQKSAADAMRAPKMPTHPNFDGPLNYAYHFDAARLVPLLQEQAIANGTRHIVDTLEEALLDEQGAIAGVRCSASGVLTADLYIDCTGFRAELIGKALNQPWRSVNDVLFCDSAMAFQVPYVSPDAPIASYTISTAQPSGWIWDIGIDDRRGVGHVFSSRHTDSETAERALRSYAGPAADKLNVRSFKFDAGFREVNWYKNCVAIGLSSGFFEPLEATGIVFAEMAANLVSNLFPWGGDFESAARQFNANMLKRYERTLDFIKLHYSISKRRDSQFWMDNVDPASSTASLIELLDRWRYRPPNELDIDPNIDIFDATSWQYVLYGMGWQTDLSARAGSLRMADEAKAAFAEVRRQSDFAIQNLPSNRDLVRHAAHANFG